MSTFFKNKSTSNARSVETELRAAATTSHHSALVHLPSLRRVVSVFTMVKLYTHRLHNKYSSSFKICETLKCLLITNIDTIQKNVILASKVFQPVSQST